MSDDEDPKRETMTSREVAELLGLDRNRVFHLARTKPDFPKPFRIAMTANHQRMSSQSKK